MRKLTVRHGYVNASSRRRMKDRRDGMTGQVILEISKNERTIFFRLKSTTQYPIGKIMLDLNAPYNCNIDSVLEISLTKALVGKISSVLAALRL